MILRVHDHGARRVTNQIIWLIDDKTSLLASATAHSVTFYSFNLMKTEESPCPTQTISMFILLFLSSALLTISLHLLLFFFHHFFSSAHLHYLYIFPFDHLSYASLSFLVTELFTLSLVRLVSSSVLQF